jgi:hypothetical protein
MEQKEFYNNFLKDNPPRTGADILIRCIIRSNFRKFYKYNSKPIPRKVQNVINGPFLLPIVRRLYWLLNAKRLGVALFVMSELCMSSAFTIRQIKTYFEAEIAGSAPKIPYRLLEWFCESTFDDEIENSHPSGKIHEIVDLCDLLTSHGCEPRLIDLWDDLNEPNQFKKYKQKIPKTNLRDNMIVLYEMDYIDYEIAHYRANAHDVVPSERLTSIVDLWLFGNILDIPIAHTEVFLDLVEYGRKLGVIG